MKYTYTNHAYFYIIANVFYKRTLHSTAPPHLAGGAIVGKLAPNRSLK